MVRPPAWSALLMLAALSCGSGVRYADTLPLSDVMFRAGGGRLTGRVPEGWSMAAPAETGGGDSSGTLVIGHGDSLRIVLRRLILDSTAVAYFGGKGPGELAVLNRTLRDTSSAGRSGGITRFSAGGKECAAYEVATESGRTRVTIIRSGGDFFECEAEALRKLDDEKSYDRLFSVQQSMIRSIR